MYIVHNIDSILQYYQLPTPRILSKMSRNNKDQVVSDSLKLDDFKTCLLRNREIELVEKWISKWISRYFSCKVRSTFESCWNSQHGISLVLKKQIIHNKISKSIFTNETYLKKSNTRVRRIKKRKSRKKLSWILG